MKKMKKVCMILALLAVTFTVMAACTNRPKPAQTTDTTAATADDDVMAPNFELPDLVWCIRGFPAMKDVYAKYKDDLEILGVDCQDSERKWRTAVEQYDLPWLQVRCPDDMMDNLAQMYGIEGFPTKAVVSPEGKLLKVVVGEDPEFYTYLDELLGEN